MHRGINFLVMLFSPILLAQEGVPQNAKPETFVHEVRSGFSALASAEKGSDKADSKLQTASPQMVITFDDLPAHGPLPPALTRLQVAAKIIGALQAARVPPTYGFVNGALLEQQPADIVVLQAWRAAGNLLGNHTWSHMNLNQHGPEEFQADINRNDALLEDLMKDED